MTSLFFVMENTKNDSVFTLNNPCFLRRLRLLFISRRMWKIRAFRAFRGKKR